MLNFPLFRALLPLLVLITACGDDDRPPPPADGGPTGSDGGPTGELDCPAIFDCIDLCAAGDDPCIDACVARGSAEGVALATDVVTCAEANSCTDEACLTANCGPELAACAGAAPTCEEIGVPQMTGPITGLSASYIAGDPITVGIPVDEDTARVSVGVYEIGTKLYLGGNAYDTTGPGTTTVDLFAGVVDGKVGTFYLSVQLCSTTICTTPTVRTTYQRADRTAPYTAGETYTHTRENVGGTPLTKTCTTAIPIQTFEIN